MLIGASTRPENLVTHLRMVRSETFPFMPSFSVWAAAASICISCNASERQEDCLVGVAGSFKTGSVHKLATASVTPVCDGLVTHLAISHALQPLSPCMDEVGQTAKSTPSLGQVRHPAACGMRPV